MLQLYLRNGSLLTCICITKSRLDYNRGFTKGQALGKLIGCEDDLASFTKFDHPEEAYLIKTFRSKRFACMSVKASYLPHENINETPYIIKNCH